MPLNIRRVVTGHDAQGRAKVLIDETCTHLVSRRPGHQSTVAWSTGESPADNNGDADGGARTINGTDPNGTVFRIIEYGPGVSPRNHRTDTIDYAIVMSGAIDMGLDDGVVVHLKAGDVLVQRGTIHNWVNKGAVPCVIAFTLIGAKPVTVNGKPLNAQG